ncbi:hypothetical protein BU24DRAFT_427763 [Aaosphaeria arxii CBS 175.79]|uniref:Wax synthase domain-containing protein n=1 Tax=Aaosphaeria arxii CBS 175.79 TaxID=1450172 RepID=A0A6A5XCD4_9PLEO|nr:uncharacterized protein BU24DRAFT_427763 [Aaosphaeria arxii CBS 175.79]KAF2010652.1 hypothetical protein BU24DRAFT_427763 [Aaosphaeria arxii CBS 175.79]
MDLIAKAYPPLDQRKPFPIFYQPIVFALTLIPFLLPNRRIIAVFVSLPLLILCIQAPRYTAGSAPGDYYGSSTYIAILLWFIEFAICTPENGPGEPIFIGAPPDVKTSKKERQAWSHLISTRQRLNWAFSLMIPSHRGIGWNWQIKNIPSDPYRHLAKWTYVRKHLTWVLISYARSVLWLVLLGFSSNLQGRQGRSIVSVETAALNALIGWSGGFWVWDRLSAFYSLLAAISVAFGVCETWQWPPLMGDISKAYSVGNVWSVTYHSIMRKMVSQPALRITRLLRFRKGGLGSRCSQLFLSFAFSCLVHQFQMFCVTRRDMGEFAFFMSQPVAIVFEECVRAVWRKMQDRGQFHGAGLVGKQIGYIWMFLWFSYSLPIYVKGFRDAGTTSDILFQKGPMDLGAQLAERYLG